MHNIRKNWWAEFETYSWKAIFSPNFTHNLGMFRSVSRELQLSRTCGFHRNMSTIMGHDFEAFPRQINEEMLRKMRKNTEKWHFSPPFLTKLRRRFTGGRNQIWKNVLRVCKKNYLCSFWKSKRILIWTIRPRGIAVLESPPKFGTFATFPNFGRTRIFLNMRISPKCGHNQPLIGCRK